MEELSIISQIKQNLLQLQLSQTSIESSSYFILDQCFKDKKLISQVIHLWDEVCNSEEYKINKLGMIYLANDILLRRLNEKEFPFRNMLFREKILKNVPKIYSKLSNKSKKAVNEIIEIWKDSGLFDSDFYYCLESNLNLFETIRETTLDDLIRSGKEIYIPNKVINLIDQCDNFIKKRDYSRKIKDQFKDGKSSKEKYINAVVEENQMRKLVINLFSKDVVQSKFIIYERHLVMLGEIDELINRINDYKKF